MSFEGLNWVGVVVGIIFTFASGFIWFGPKTMYPVWVRAMGRDPQQPVPGGQQNMAAVFGGTFAAIVFQVITLGVVVTTVQHAHPNIGILDGAAIGFWLGLGLAAMPNLGHRLFSGMGFKVWIIENANDVLNLTVVGAIIAAFN